MLRLFDILKKVETSVKFEKNSRNTEVPKLKILVGWAYSEMERRGKLSLSSFSDQKGNVGMRERREREREGGIPAVFGNRGSRRRARSPD